MLAFPNLLFGLLVVITSIDTKLSRFYHSGFVDKVLPHYVFDKRFVKLSSWILDQNYGILKLFVVVGIRVDFSGKTTVNNH